MWETCPRFLHGRDLACSRTSYLPYASPVIHWATTIRVHKQKCKESQQSNLWWNKNVFRFFLNAFILVLLQMSLRRAACYADRPANENVLSPTSYEEMKLCSHSVGGVKMMCKFSETLIWLCLLTARTSCTSQHANCICRQAYLSQLIHDYQYQPACALSHKLSIFVPKTTLALSTKAFSVSAPSIWNMSYNCRSAKLLFEAYFKNWAVWHCL